MEAFFGKTDAEFTVQGTYPGPACSNSSDVIGPRHLKSFSAAVEDTKLGRMHAHAHFNVSVRHGVEVGAKSQITFGIGTGLLPQEFSRIRVLERRFHAASQGWRMEPLDNGILKI